MSPQRQITRDNLIARLQNTVPDFAINPDWRDDNLGYPIINHLARFICDRAGMEDFEQVRTGVRFLEMGLEGGDEYVCDLVLEALETLAACQHFPAVQGYCGPRLRDLWTTIRQAF
jgi:hypothetical protein